MRNLVFGSMLAAASAFSSAALAGTPTVAWDWDYEELDIDYGVAVDFKFDYTVNLNGSTRSTPLYLRTCEDPASEVPLCYMSRLQYPAKNGDASIRYGVDSSQYNIGTNVYTLTLILGNRTVTDTFTLVVNVY
jgi:hypothetical protein